MRTSLQAHVDYALDQAVFANGYVMMLTWSPQEIATDLVQFDAGLEDVETKDVVPCVQDYLERWEETGKQEYKELNP